MGIVSANPSQYETSFRKLFPRGDYWDRQFADPQSDVSLFCKVKLPEFIRFRCRMDALRDESKLQTTEELLNEWERVLLGFVSAGGDKQQRKTMLIQKNNNTITRTSLQAAAQLFGFFITDIQFPYRPAFFGFSLFCIDRIASPASWQAINILVNTQGNSDQITQFENYLRALLLANYIPNFFYDGGES